MNTTYDFGEEAGERPVDRIVYVRPVAVADLPDEVRAHADGRAVIYAVHAADGERLALVADRQMAFRLARLHDMAPVSVH